MSGGRFFLGRRGLAPVHALIGALVLLAAGFVASAYEDRVFRAQRGNELTVQGEVLAASVTAALVFGDAEAVREHVTALSINPEIAAAGVYGASRDLVASFARNGAASLPSKASDRVAGYAADAVTIVPVRHEGQRLGTVYICAREEPLERRLAGHVPMMLLAIMAALLLAVMGTAQRTLREAKPSSKPRALALADANRLLQREMEQRSKAEEALRQSQKMEAVGRLAGGIAHDFNNLLTIIQGNLHLLRMLAAGGREESLRHVSDADVAADRAGQLVQRLLAFSRRQPLSSRPRRSERARDRDENADQSLRRQPRPDRVGPECDMADAVRREWNGERHSQSRHQRS